MDRLTPAVLGFASALFFTTDAFAAQRAFVASYGNDANSAAGCLLANPCRTFAAAMTAVDAGGEVVALDAAGYGTVVIDKSVTITSNPGFFAAISSSGVIAVQVAASGATVVLRGLHIKGLGGGYGIQMSVPGSLTVENCVVSNFDHYGIAANNHDVKVRIIDTTVRNNQSGITIASGLPATLHNVRMSHNAKSGLWVFDETAQGDVHTVVTITDSDASHNGGVGFFVAGGTGGARLSIDGSSATGNDYGVAALGMGAVIAIGRSILTKNGAAWMGLSGGTIETYGNNLVRYNDSPPGAAVTVTGQ